MLLSNIFLILRVDYNTGWICWKFDFRIYHKTVQVEVVQYIQAMHFVQYSFFIDSTYVQNCLFKPTFGWYYNSVRVSKHKLNSLVRSSKVVVFAVIISSFFQIVTDEQQKLKGVMLIVLILYFVHQTIKILMTKSISKLD